MCRILNSESIEDIRDCDLLLLSVQSTGYPWRLGFHFTENDHVFLQVKSKIKYFTYSSIFIVNYVFDSTMCLLGFYKTLGPGLISYDQLRTLKLLIRSPFLTDLPGMTLEIQSLIFSCFHSEGVDGYAGKIFLDCEYSDNLASYLAMEFSEWQGTFVFYKHIL